MEDLEQRSELDAFIAATIPGMVLLDIGAHFGIFSLAALHYGGPSAQAIAVDASPFATRMIETQARLNQTGPSNLEVVTAMVGDHVGEGEMVSVGVIAGGYFVVPSSSHSSADRSRIRMTTVDELSLSYAVTPSHIKIDVEGFEASVLRGALDTLSDHSPILFLELHHAMIRQAGGNPRDTIDMLEQQNYRLFDSDGQPVSAEAALARDLIRVIARKVI